MGELRTVCGTGVEGKPFSKAMGLRGIRERAKLLGGQARIESESGKGTKIAVDLPLETPEDDADDSGF